MARIPRPQQDRRLNLAEILLLLAVYADGGTIRRGYRLGLALAGAELAQLAMEERISAEGHWLRATDRSAIDDSDLGHVLNGLAARPLPTPVRAWLDYRQPAVYGIYLDRLQCLQAVRRERRRVFGLLNAESYSLCDTEIYGQARELLDAASLDGALDRPQAAALGALAYHAGLSRALYPGSKGRTARWALRRLAFERPAPEPLAAVLAAVGAAIEAALAVLGTAY